MNKWTIVKTVAAAGAAAPSVPPRIGSSMTRCSRSQAKTSSRSTPSPRRGTQSDAAVTRALSVT